MDSDDLSDLTDLSSELSSPPRELSPPPSMHYPSPESSQDHSACTSGSEQISRKRGRESEHLPPAKKRKPHEVKPRSTVYLDLRSTSAPPATEQASQLDLLLKVLRKRRKIVVIAGAGISTSAGVPDFRSSTGLFNTLRNDNKLKASGKHLFDASVYQTDSSTAGFHDMVRTLSKLVRDAIPTEFHEMLATLGGEGRLMRLYTQNVDGIDTSLEPLKTSVPLAPKGPWPRTIQLHGSLEIMVCSKCNALFPFQAALFDGPNPPPCTACITNDEVRTTHAGKRSHGIGKLRPRMVLYNEHNPDEEAIGTVVTADLRSRPDAVIVVGTSMEIPGVKRIVREMCGVVRGRRDGLAVWINRGPPPIGKEFEDCWDLVVKGDCDKVAGLADMRRWDDVCDPVSILVTESEAKRAKEKEGEMKVIVKSPCKKKAEAGLMTPAPSPKLGPTKVPVKLLLNAPKSLGSDNDKKPKPKSTSRFSRPAKAKTATSKSTKPSKAKSTTKPTPTLSTAFKVTKRTRSPPAAKKAPPQTREDPRPFDPIPPHSARSNSTVPSPPHQSVALNLDQIKAEKTGVFAEIPGNDAAEARRGSGGRLSEMRDTIVSPTGRVSPEMRSLLN